MSGRGIWVLRAASLTAALLALSASPPLAGGGGDRGGYGGYRGGYYGYRGGYGGRYYGYGPGFGIGIGFYPYDYG